MAKIGEVIFSINGTNYTAGVVDGVAKINVYFDEVGDYVISANYQNNGLYNGSFVQKTVSVTKTDVNLTADIGDIVYGENPIVNINLTSVAGVNVTGDVVLTISGKKYIVNVVNALAVFEIPEMLDAGKYHAEISYLGSEKYNAADGATDFTVAKKEITMDVTVDKDYSCLLYTSPSPRD